MQTNIKTLRAAIAAETETDAKEPKKSNGCEDKETGKIHPAQTRIRLTSSSVAGAGWQTFLETSNFDS